MTRVRDILKTKSIKGIISINPEASVAEAIKMLGEHNVGALVVMKEGMPVGFVSERDFLRRAHRSSLTELESKTVEEVMTREVILAVPEDDVSYIAAIMIRNKIRHLPIIHKKEIVGLVSIGDVVYSQIEDEKFENNMLLNYIVGKYPA